VARDGEILNTGILQRMADFLNIGGVRRYPKQLNTDIVQPVYILGGLGLEPAPVFSLQKYSPTAVNIGTQAGFSQDISGAAATSASQPMYENDNYAMDLVGLEITITMDPAGVAAMLGAKIMFRMDRYARYGSLDPMGVMTPLQLFTITTGVTTYYVNLGTFQQRTAASAEFVSLNMNSLHVPKGDRLSFSILPDGGDWAANTTIYYSAHAFTYEEVDQVAWAGLS